MKSFWTKSAMGAAAALLCAGAANAYVIDFEGVDTSSLPLGDIFLGGDQLAIGNYVINTQDVGGGDGLLGSIRRAADPSSCLDGGPCASNNSTDYLQIDNDGLLHIYNGSPTLTSISFSSAQVAFLKASGDTAGSTAMYFAVEADSYTADGTMLGYTVYAAPVSGSGSFVNITTTAAGTLTGGQALGSWGNLSGAGLNNAAVTDLFFYAYYCNPTSGSCAAFKSDKGQYAIDNIALDVSAVPEPSEWMLMVAGLGAVGGIVRRRRNNAA